MNDHMDTIGGPSGIYGKEEPYDLECNDRVHQCIALPVPSEKRSMERDYSALASKL